MPQSIDALAQRLAEAVSDAHAMLDRLRPLLPEQDGAGPATGTIGRHAPESSEPWSKPAADAYWNLWFGPGRLVGTLRYALGMSHIPDDRLPVGPEALAKIGKLAAGAPVDTARYVVRKLEQWCDLARRIPAIDESEPWDPLPAVPGGTPPACPYCGTFGLRMQRRRGQVRCTFPGCTDSDGNTTRARMEPGRMTGEARMVFGDGMTMHWAGEVESDGL